MSTPNKKFGNKLPPFELVRLKALKAVSVFVLVLMIVMDLGLAYCSENIVDRYPNFIDSFYFIILSVIVLLLLHYGRNTLGKHTAIFGWGGLILFRDIVGNVGLFYIEPFCILISIGGIALFDSKKQQGVNFIFAVLLLVITSYNLFFPYNVPTESLPPDVTNNFITYLSLLIALSITIYILTNSITKNERESIAQFKKIENLKLEQKKYLANVAYEIETQIGSIMNHTNLLSPYPSNSESFYKIQKHSNQLLDFSHQISNLINEEVDENTLSIVRFQLSDLIRELWGDFQLAAQEQGINLSIPTYIPDVEIISDVDKLYLTLKSLISNALKYNSRNGNISINILAQDITIQMIIQDDGIGISSEDLPHIFNRYFKNTPVELPILESTGISLNVCKKYIELLGGKITVRSKLNEGSTFTLTFLKKLPTEDLSIIKPFNFTTFSEVTPANKRTDAATDENDTMKHLLIVEDDVSIYDFITNILSTEFRLDFVSNIGDAWIFLQNQQTDLIIMDLNLLATNDMVLLDKIKGDNKLKELPTLIFTTKIALSSQIKAMRLGANDYILKPFDGNVLKTYINHLLKPEESEEIAAENEPTATAEENSLPKEELADSPIPFKNSKTLNLSREETIWLEKFEEIVLRLYDDVYLNIDKVADEMAISATHLNRKANSILGISPKKYILEVRLNTAMKMLKNKEYDSVKAVAYSSGFKSEKVFSKNFQKRFGKYPSDVLSKKSS